VLDLAVLAVGLPQQITGVLALAFGLFEVHTGYYGSRTKS
jgi:hypothetical protein